MRTVLTYRRPEGAPAAGDPEPRLAPGLDPELAGMLLVHLTAAQLHASYDRGEPMFGDLPESLAMEMVANGLFHGGEQPDVLLARTRMLWNTYGSQIDLDQAQAARPPAGPAPGSDRPGLRRHRRADASPTTGTSAPSSPAGRPA